MWGGYNFNLGVAGNLNVSASSYDLAAPMPQQRPSIFLTTPGAGDPGVTSAAALLPERITSLCRDGFPPAGATHTDLR